MARSITIRSTNPKIMDDNIKILDNALAVASTPPAEDVSYDNTDSGLTATDVQAAIDETAKNVDGLKPKEIYSFTPDGTTTISAALDALYAENILTIRSKIKIGTTCFTITELLSGNIFASSSNIIESKITIICAQITSSGSKFTKSETTTSGTTFIDLSSNTELGFVVYNY